jgi:hypothetical protein
LEIQLSRDGDISLSDLTMKHMCVCRKPESGFLPPYVMVFYMFNAFRQEVTLRFLDIDGIADHHCLHFLLL